MLIDACVLPRSDAEVQVVATSPVVHWMLELALDALESGSAVNSHTPPWL